MDDLDKVIKRLSTGGSAASPRLKRNRKRAQYKASEALKQQRDMIRELEKP